MTEEQRQMIWTEAIRRGYRFEQVIVSGRIEERLIRPDGSVAVIARKPVMEESK